jgi:hypothetical protein
MGTILAVLLQVTVAVTTVARGADSQITEPREVVVRTADEWRTLWAAHSAARAPNVDFSRAIVVGVFLGSRPTAGYAVEVVTVKSEGALTVVEYRERRPPSGGFSAQMLTAPFHLASVSRTVATKIEFRRLESPN